MLPTTKVRGLPPGVIRYKLTKACSDSTGHIHGKGTDFVAISGGYDNPARNTYQDVVLIKSGK